jgi:hypothetical protein
VFHVALVAHQYHLRVVPRVRLDLRDPAKDARTHTKSLLIQVHLMNCFAQSKPQGECTSNRSSKGSTVCVLTNLARY